MTASVVRLLDLSDERWMTFVTLNPLANVFHHPAWAGTMAACYGYHPFVVAVCDTSGEIRAGMPVMQVGSRLTGRRWVSLPFTDHCAPLFDSYTSLSDLLDELVHLFPDNHLSRVEVRWECPTHPAIRPFSRYVLHTLRLQSDFEEVARQFGRTNRQNVRTAERSQLRVEWGTQLDDLRRFYDLQLFTRRRHGLPAQPWSYFECFENGLLGRGLGSILLAYKDNEYLAGVVLLHWQRTLICKYAASRLDGQNLRPNDLLFWTAIRWGCENGYELFDMGRSDMNDSGLRRFKNGWGAQETPLTYSVLGVESRYTVPRGLAVAMRAAVRRSPIWLCRTAGTLLYKYFA